MAAQPALMAATARGTTILSPRNGMATTARPNLSIVADGKLDKGAVDNFDSPRRLKRDWGSPRGSTIGSPRGSYLAKPGSEAGAGKLPPLLQGSGSPRDAWNKHVWQTHHRLERRRLKHQANVLRDGFAAADPGLEGVVPGAQLRKVMRQAGLKAPAADLAKFDFDGAFDWKSFCTSMGADPPKKPRVARGLADNFGTGRLDSPRTLALDSPRAPGTPRAPESAPKGPPSPRRLQPVSSSRAPTEPPTPPASAPKLRPSGPPADLEALKAEQGVGGPNLERRGSFHEHGAGSVPDGLTHLGQSDTLGHTHLAGRQLERRPSKVDDAKALIVQKVGDRYKTLHEAFRKVRAQSGAIRAQFVRNSWRNSWRNPRNSLRLHALGPARWTSTRTRS